MSRAPKSGLLYGLIAFCLSGLITLILLEILFRFLPISDTFLSQPVTYEQPVARFKPNRDVTWSQGFDFNMVNDRHVNNDGFFNDQNYSADDPRPLIAVMGDSFVEAAMVPYEETLYARLDKTLPDHRVYSFAASGAPLSQYLVWAKYARETYKAEKMVFVIIANDFDESLPKYTFFQTFLQFVPDENGKLTPTLIKEYKPDWKRSLVTHSALARYLFMNLQLYMSWQNLRSKLIRKELSEKTLYVGNVPARASDERLADSYKAVDAFFDNLPDYTGLAPRDITFVVDAPRVLIYDEDKIANDGQSYFEKMRDYFLKTAKARGYETVDLLPAFKNDYKKHHKKFEYPMNGHWSGYGHSVANDALTETRWFKRLQN